MKQDAFIQKLRDELGSLPKSTIDDIIADYREYIGDALAAGRDEQEVIAALGDPVKLARELKAQASYREWESHRSFRNLARVVASIAGLGLLNMLLLIPFMIYLAFLTIGYVVSIGLVIAGIAGVATLGSHQVFGWPPIHGLPFDMQIRSDSDDEKSAALDAKTAAQDAKAAAQDERAAARDAQNAARDAQDDARDARDEASANAAAKTDTQPASTAIASSAVSATTAASTLPADESELLTHVKGFKITGDTFVFTLNDDAHVAIVTTAGSVSIHRADAGLRIAASNTAVQNQITITHGDTVSIARKDVITFSLHSDDSRVSLARDPRTGGHLYWDVRSDGKRMSFIENSNGEPAHLSIKDGDSTVELNGQELKIDDGNDHIRFHMRPGSTIASTGLVYGIAALLGGIAGLLLCLWLTRLTWRALVRYAKRQVDLITTRLEGNEM